MLYVFYSNIMGRVLSALFLVVLSSCSSNSNSDEIDSDNRPPGFSDVVEKAWNLERFMSDTGEIKNVHEETLYQIYLDSSSLRLRGFVGCVNTFGNYTVADGFLTLSLGIRDGQLCDTDVAPYLQQTTEIMQLMSQGDQFPLMYVVDANVLTLASSNGRFLEFAEVDSIEMQQ